MATFGYTTIGAVDVSNGWGGSFYVCKFTAPANSIISKITAYLKWALYPNNALAVILSDNNGVPGNVLATGPDTVIPAGYTWTDFPINYIAVGGTIWIGIYQNNPNYGEGDAGSTNQTYIWAQGTYPTVPSSYAPTYGPQTNNIMASIYATYTTSGDPQNWAVTISAGTGGTVTPASMTGAQGTSTGTITATPNSGYQISQWLFDGVALSTTAPSITVGPINDTLTHTLQVTFVAVSPPPPTGTILLNSCDTAVIGGDVGDWFIAEGAGGTGLSTIALNNAKYTTPPSSIQLSAAAGCWGVWFGWRSYLQYSPWIGRDLSQNPILEFDVASDLQDPQTKISVVLNFTYKYDAIIPAAGFKRASVDLRLPSDGTIPDLTNIGYIQWLMDSGRAIIATTTAQIDNVTASVGPPLSLRMTYTPQATTVLAGTQVNFTSSVLGGTTPYAYKWTLDGSLVGTASACTITAPSALGDHTVIFTVTDAAGATISGTAILTVYQPKPAPINPGPWHTIGHKIFDANGTEVYPRSAGTAAGEMQSTSGMWSGKGDLLWDWGSKWLPVGTELQRRMDDTLQCMNQYWYCNNVRVQGVVAEWWWTDHFNPSQRYAQGPNTTLSCRDYWEFFAQRIIPANLQLMFSMASVFSVYESAAGGQPGNLTAAGAAFIQTVDPDEMTAWGKIWTSIAQRLGSYPNMIWELWNEPDTSTTALSDAYFNYIVAAYKAIRGAGDNHIILLQSGLGQVPTWQGEMSWVPDLHKRLTAALGTAPTNVAYVGHFYRHSPWFNQQWGTDYATVYAQLTNSTFIPITRNNVAGVDVPVWCTETGVMLAQDIAYPGPPSPAEPQRLNDDLGWWSGLLQACRELGVGLNMEFWMPTGQWPYDEAMIQGPPTATWPAGTPSPNPTVSAQMFIDAYAGALPPPITLTVAAGSNGAVTPTGPQSLSLGQIYTFTAIPAQGYQLDHWDLAGTNLGSTSPLSITAASTMNGETLTAIFAAIPPSTISLNVTAGANGSVSPAGPQTLTIGQNYTFTATPNSGYQLSYWSLSGQNIGSTSSISITASSTINGETLTAIFTALPPSTITFTVVSGANGGVSPSGPQTLTIGQSYTFTATPNSGYAFSYWDLNGTNISSGASITLTASSAINGSTLTAHFVAAQITLLIVAGANGTVSPSGAQTLTIGQSYTFTANANPEYQFSYWDLNGTNISSNSSLTLTASLAMNGETLTAHFTQVQITLTVAAGANGTVSPAGSQILTIGTSYSFAAVPASGYQIDHWDLSGTNIGSTNPMSLVAALTMNGKTLTALFTSIPVQQITLNIAVTGVGTTNLANGPHTFNVGDSVTLTATPGSEYAFSQWTLGAAIYQVNPLTIVIAASMNGQTLTAVFVETIITLNVAAGPNGSVSPQGSWLLNIGQAYLFTATPDSGYHFDHWDLSGTSKGSTNPLSLIATLAMNNETLTAFFTATPPTTITLTLAVTGTGTTDLAPGAHTFNIGDTVTVTATPGSAAAFVKWTLDGADYSTTNPLQLSITADLNDRTLTAIFTTPSTPNRDPLIVALVIAAAVAGATFA